ncbi:MAG: GIY-YIG nuclease family protein [Candidatus Marinimicrobia bacterium]|nr:GIY-YIG nuclease family protein [Candidatus Neomarinimicrobiota bacterium]
MLSNKMRTTLYVGVTNDLERRLFEHKTGHGSTFCKKYNITDLMYYEEYPSINDAIDREKQLKRWHKKWKWNLIKTKNKHLFDISREWYNREIRENIEECKKLNQLPEYYRKPWQQRDPETRSG